MQENEIPDSPIGDALNTVSEQAEGFLLRYCAGPRPSLNWQAGIVANEHRNYRGSGMTEPFNKMVSLFRLRGWGCTKQEAVTMALNKRKGIL